jgi:Lambda phage tail tape-measure protein (Tape_meas_lam_C)
MPMSAAIVAGGGLASSLIGGAGQLFMQNKSIDAQQNLLTRGLTAAQNWYGNATTAANNALTGAEDTLSPYVSAGVTGLQNFMKALPNLTKPFDASQLASTPGYQFTLGQGLEKTTSQQAAQGGAVSGNEGKAVADYTTGLAQNTYNQQLANYLAQNNQIANLLYQPVNAGLSAGGTLAGIQGQLGTALTSGATSLGGAALGGSVTTGQGIANALTGSGNAIAGAATGASNALTSGVQYSILAPYIQAMQANQLAQANAANAGNSGGYIATSVATNGLSSPATPFTTNAGSTAPFTYAGG